MRIPLFQGQSLDLDQLRMGTRRRCMDPYWYSSSEEPNILAACWDPQEITILLLRISEKELLHDSLDFALSVFASVVYHPIMSSSGHCIGAILFSHVGYIVSHAFYNICTWRVTISQKSSQ